MSIKNVLIVEDESIVAMELAGYVESLGLRVSAIASSADKAYEAVSNNQVDLLLMDIHLKGDVDGVSCAAEIKKKQDVVMHVAWPLPKNSMGILTPGKQNQGSRRKENQVS